MPPKGATGKDKTLQNSNNATESKIHCDEAAGHLKTGNHSKALHAYNLALELNPRDKNALVARSKCYLLLGEPQLALKDAETALQGDKNFIRAIFQKAESLYHLGDFEHSLMYYHRGLRIRPELEGFRLGIQKAQEAIENTIGKQLPQANESMMSVSSNKSSARNRCNSSKSRVGSAASKQQSRRLLGELCVDKDYLEQLLQDPDIKCMNKQDDKNLIASYAEEGVAFLTRREEFWRQQRANTSATYKGKKKQNLT